MYSSQEREVVRSLASKALDTAVIVVAGALALWLRQCEPLRTDEPVELSAPVRIERIDLSEGGTPCGRMVRTWMGERL